MTTTHQTEPGVPPDDVPLENGERVGTPTTWLIRAGAGGEVSDYNFKHGVARMSYSGYGVPDLRNLSSLDDLVEAMRSAVSDTPDGRRKPKTIAEQARQIWMFGTEVRVGHLVVMPRMTDQIAVGMVTREYWYDADGTDPDWPHCVSVKWRDKQVLRTDLKDDLLSSINAPGTIHPIRCDDAPWRLKQVMETGRDPGARVGDATGPENADADLSALIEQFRSKTGDRTDAHKEQERLREEWAKKLSRENVASLSPEDLTAYTNSAVGYGEYVKPVEGVMKWIRDLDGGQYDRLRESIRDLCWGEGELSARIDRLLNWYGGSHEDTGTKNFAQGNVSATLAICHPDRFLPIFGQEGVWGRVHMLRKLGLPEPEGATFGQQVVDANDRLRQHLAPHLHDDPLAIATFLYWLREHDDRAGGGLGGDTIDLDELAAKLLVEVGFLKDIVELLQDKGQVILYGPPGTGKTYLARELAEALAPDDSCRALVQFHPSTSYEDFFEGYRPAGTGNDGNVRYELTPGPLARMAERAEDSDQRHVMIIDEINRGNLPRVLGELLFLLEYRDEIVQTLYRPEGEPFSLPGNLWFIGTMNTADRSIALVDAALRRRFHFVRFFPDRGPMVGLLGRWLDREGKPAWVGHLVDAVNNELKEILEGSHLLLGPSHFMKEYGSSLDTQRERLRRIWEYNIEPFIEDQFFGDPQQIDRFRFDAVMRRNGPLTESGADTSGDGDDLENTDGSDAAAERDAATEPGLAQTEDEG